MFLKLVERVCSVGSLIRQPHVTRQRCRAYLKWPCRSSEPVSSAPTKEAQGTADTPLNGRHVRATTRRRVSPTLMGVRVLAARLVGATTQRGPVAGV
jgi:hypothetical protein